MNTSHPALSRRDREIGRRLKTFRAGLRFSQAAFARQVGLTRDQLAAVEYGRTPLKYAAAWQIREVFGLSLDWLAGGDTDPDDLAEDAPLPHPGARKIDKNASLSEVFCRVHDLAGRSSHARHQRSVRVNPAELARRWYLAMTLRNEADYWLAAVPDARAADLHGQIFQVARSYLAGMPPEPDALINARLAGLRWERMRLAALTNLREAGPGGILAKKAINGSAMIPGFGPEMEKPLWPQLKHQLQNATSEFGQKSVLAKFLQVDLAIVSRWLADTTSAREPGAEYALQMLRWLADRGAGS